MTDLEKEILSILKSHIGEENKLTQYEITGIIYPSDNEYFDDSKCRQVRLAIVNLIEQGYPIVSTPKNGGGYHWQDKPEEGLECARRIRRQGIRLLLKARNILRNSRLNQMKMFDKVI